MLNLSHQRLRRVCAGVLTFCYIWLSVAGAFLHHCVPPLVPSADSVPTVAAPSHAEVLQEAPSLSDSHAVEGCSVCEWQAVNVSPALPVFEVLPSFSLQQRVVTTFPRYLKTVTVFASSRAPPFA